MDPTKELTGDIGTAQGLYQKYLPNGPLGKIDPRRTQEQNELGALRWSFANPAYGSFAGNFQRGTKDLLELRKSQLDKNSSNYAGATSDAMKSLLEQRKSAMDPNSAMFAGNRSSNMRDIISRFRAGLDGYTSQENAALVGQARQGLNSQYSANRAAAAASNARNRVGGAAAAASERDAARERLDAERLMQNDLLVRNIDEKQNRLKDFATLMSETEREEYLRSQAATQSYQDLLRSNEDTNYGRVQDAFDKYSTLYKNSESEAYARGQDAIAQYQAYLEYLQGRERDAELFNIGQDEKTAARDVGGIMGLLGMLQSRRSAQEQNKILAKG